MRVYECPELSNFEIWFRGQWIGSMHFPLVITKNEIPIANKINGLRDMPLYFACIYNETLLLAVRSMSCTGLCRLFENPIMSIRKGILFGSGNETEGLHAGVKSLDTLRDPSKWEIASPPLVVPAS